MIQLKIKTEYSFGRTFAPIARVIDRLKEIGCTHAGIVDSSTWGHVAWFNACKEADIVPLLGVEIVVADQDQAPLKMWFLAKDTAALQALYGFSSKSYSQKISTPQGAVNRLYRSDVRDMPEGIIKFAGDIVDGCFLKGIGAYIDLSPASLILNAKKRAVSEKYDLTIVETSDNSFAFEDDSEPFELVSKSSLKMTPMHILDKLGHQSNAAAIVKGCEDLELPSAPMVRAEGDLEALCREGIKSRFDNKCPACEVGAFRLIGYGDTATYLCNDCDHEWEPTWTQEYKDRLVYELDLIRSKDYESYFIIVADMVHYAKERMLVGVSRGSAAGSLVCYLARITEVDPIKAGLFFERFIDINRSDLPDIDLDFPDNKRHLVFEYMADKYGVNNTAHIGTISRFRPKSALIKVSNLPADQAATKAALIEGHASHTGVHAAGLLVCNNEITDYCTVDDKGIAHVEKYSAEQLGLLKIDVLGLRTLSILEDGTNYYDLELNDPKVFDVFNNHNLCGIFQFEGQAMRGVARQITFNSIDDICAVVALARPGPLQSGVTEEYIKRKNGKKHKTTSEYMVDTYDLPIFQEQTLAIVRNIGGFSWSDTSKVRKSFSTKDDLNVFKSKFIAGAIKNKFSEEEAVKIWDMISDMGKYQMNKAHTYSYAIISYWTAYFKAYHPLEFTVSNLRHIKTEDDAIQLLREMHSEYVPFDIDKSEKDWSVIDGKIYGGFTSLKGISEVKAGQLIAARDAGTLTDKQKDKILNAHNPYANIFPFHAEYQDMYDNPRQYGVVNPIVEIDTINLDKQVPHKEERVFMGELIFKNARDYNEIDLIKKRNGVAEKDHTSFVDVRLRDDHGMIGGRIGRFDFERCGIDLLNNVPIGTKLLVRAVFYNGYPWAFIKKWKRLEDVR